MSFNQIIFWKWDDSDFRDDTYLKKVDDVFGRSVFDTLLVALTWCKPSINEKAGHEAIARAVERTHSHGRKFLLDIDVRPARKEFHERYPNRKLGLTLPIFVTLDDNGSAEGSVETSDAGDHYGFYYPVNMRLLRAYAYSADDGGYDLASLVDVTNCCVAESSAKGQADCRISCGKESAGKSAIVFIVAEYDYPDLFSAEMLDFHQELIESYSDVPLDGATIDEWGAFPHPNFDFRLAWQRPWYSEALSEAYAKETGRDFVLDYLNMLVPPKDDPAAQIRAINDYYGLLRRRNVEIESRFYESVKRIWGSDTFVGVHPTWYAIQETANTPELWKNGLDWWDVPRDFGQTDEIAIYPVRTALAHKWGGAVFYNMWYNMGSKDISLYWKEAWENLRWGGRTHTLGYECVAEGGVMDLSGPGDLESLSEIEKLISLANLFQKTAVKSHVAVVMGYPATINWTLNVENGVWDMTKGVFCEGFAVARDLFNAGFVCDLIPSYEIDDGDLRLENGELKYGSESYDAIVFVRPEFSTGATLKFLEQLVEVDFPLALLGRCDKDSEGEDSARRYAEIASGADLALSDVDSAAVISAFEACRIPKNDIPNGARFQDGSVIICNSGQVHRGNELRVEDIQLNGHRVDAVCADAFGIALTPDGKLQRAFGGALSEIRIDGQVVFSSETGDLYVERDGDGIRVMRDS